MISRQTWVVVAGAVAVGCAAGIAASLVTARVIATTQRERAPAAVPSSQNANGENADTMIFQRQLDRHQHEPVDESWATVATQAYERDLVAKSVAYGFAVVSVDCRTTSCVGTLRFPSYGVANKSMLDLVASPWSLNCTKAMDLGPSVPTTNFTTPIYFDCSRQRASVAAKN